MTPAVVADVGNTRIKWGLCTSSAVRAIQALSPDDTGAWQSQVEAWQLRAGSVWVLTSVHPARCERL